MSKRNIILIVLICAAVALVASVFLFRPDIEKIDVNRNQPSGSVNPVPQILTKSFPSEDNSKYTIQVDYPELRGVAAPGIQEKVNGAIRAHVYNQIAAFQNANAASLPLGDPDMRSSFDGSFDVSLVSRSFLSVIMSYSDYSAGAAHPNSYNVALNYNLKTGGRVTLDQLLISLNPSDGYMDRLGKYVKEDLIRQFGDSEESLAAIDFGAAPTAQNYANFTLTATGLSVHFDPYQVAPYAAGLPEVEIPYADLMSIVVKSNASDGSATSSVKWWLE